MADKSFVKVVYASVDEVSAIELSVAKNTSVKTVIEQSGILAKHPEIDLARNKVGVYSQIKSLDDEVEDGDRIEIYRPLLIDPKEARRQRAKK